MFSVSTENKNMRKFQNYFKPINKNFSIWMQCLNLQCFLVWCIVILHVSQIRYLLLFSEIFFSLVISKYVILLSNTWMFSDKVVDLDFNFMLLHRDACYLISVFSSPFELSDSCHIVPLVKVQLQHMYGFAYHLFGFTVCVR